MYCHLKATLNMSTPLRGGGRHIVLLMSALASLSAFSSVSCQLLREPLLNFFWEACFLFPWALAFDFCYDLDLCSQGQAVESVFIGMGFSLILSKVQGGFRSNLSENFIDKWHMTFCIHCVVLKLSIL